MARILVAEDNKDIVIVLRDFIESLGHQVDCQMDGLQAGIRARDWKPDLLISDIQMPNFYGTTAVVSLQQSPDTAEIPVIFISAVAPHIVRKMMEAIRSQVKHPDRVRFIPKPIDFAALERDMKELLPPGA